MHTVKITTSQNIDIEYDAASVGDRILGYIIDLAVFFCLYIVATIIGFMSTATLGNFAGFGVPIIFIILMVLLVFYDLLCEVFMNGQSIGKKVMKIRVISLSGGRPTFGQYCIRWLMRIADMTLTSCLGALITIIVTEKKQRLGDLAAGTTVIKTVPRTNVSHLVFVPPAPGYKPVFTRAADLSEQDIVLIHEVLANYDKSNNDRLLYSMASKVKAHLGITTADTMTDLAFLTYIIQDYNYAVAEADSSAL
ncbi:RDD family protein [Hufsiella ginkgonis]|uniref:RDD family protein n=1 Tax=Hufsiella ginkgonis TaxID=2695274 RepID=A0A7K1Y3E1_9SPHI|nr:RDD family protein [Hufsiella ginkgonis]MXV17559.1 RDD family protein [Hufsiella ginkgonis]